MAKDKKAAAASLNPEDFTEGGGLIDDVDVTITEARFEMFDYQGAAKEPAPSLKLSMDIDGDEMDQNYSMGNSKDWMPSDDGKQLLAVGRATQIRMSSNGGILLKSLLDAGFPADKLGDDISILDGLQAHMIRVPAPERKGVKKTEKQKEREERYGPPTILVVGEINTLPWEKSRPKGAPKAAGKKAPAKTASKKEVASDDGDSDIDARASEVLMALLAENGGELARKDVPVKAFQALAKDPDRSSIVKRVFEEDFLSAEGQPWSYDDGTVTLG